MAESKIENSMDLLWTNPNITAEAFAPQTVEINLSQYIRILIYWKVDNNTDLNTAVFSSTLAFKNTKNNIGQGTRTHDMVQGGRQFEVTESSVIFGSGTYRDVNRYQSNSWMIPYKIYGIK